MIADWLNGTEYLWEYGSIVDKAVLVGLISIPMIVMAIFSVRHNKDKEDKNGLDNDS